MIKKILRSFLLFTFVTGSIYSQPVSDADFENFWREKQFSIGVGGGLRYMIPGTLIPTFEVPWLSWRPLSNFQLTAKASLWKDASLLAGYTTSWGRWRWYLEGGLKVMWKPAEFGISHLGPELSTGGEYLLNDWLAIGIKCNAGYMFFMGQHSVFQDDALDSSVLVSVSLLL